MEILNKKELKEIIGGVGSSHQEIDIELPSIELFYRLDAIEQIPDIVNFTPPLSSGGAGDGTF